MKASSSGSDHPFARKHALIAERDGLDLTTKLGRAQAYGRASREAGPAFRDYLRSERERALKGQQPTYLVRQTPEPGPYERMSAALEKLERAYLAQRR